MIDRAQSNPEIRFQSDFQKNDLDIGEQNKSWLYSKGWDWNDAVPSQRVATNAPSMEGGSVMDWRRSSSVAEISNQGRRDSKINTQENCLSKCNESGLHLNSSLPNVLTSQSVRFAEAQRIQVPENRRDKQPDDQNSRITNTTILQRIKNYFAGGRLDCCRAKFMRWIGHPLMLTDKQLEWRLNNGRPLTGYTLNNSNFSKLLNRKDPRRPKDRRVAFYGAQGYSLRLDHCCVKKGDLSNVVVGEGSIKDSKVNELDVTYSCLGYQQSGHGFDVRGTKGDICLKFSDLSHWKFSEKTEIANSREVNDACNKFNEEGDIGSILGIMVAIDSISDRTTEIGFTGVNYSSNTLHKVKLMDYLTSKFRSECQINKSQRRQVAIFLKEGILANNSIYNECLRPSLGKPPSQDEVVDAIKSCEEYVKNEKERLELARDYNDPDANSLKWNRDVASAKWIWKKFHSNNPDYLRKRILSIQTKEEMVMLAKAEHNDPFDEATLSSEQKDVLQLLKEKCDTFQAFQDNFGNIFMGILQEHIKRGLNCA